MQQMSGMIRYRLCGASRCGARVSKQTRANHTYADATISHLGACILGIASSSRGVQQKEIQHWLGVDRRIKEGNDLPEPSLHTVPSNTTWHARTNRIAK